MAKKTAKKTAVDADSTAGKQMVSFKLTLHAREQLDAIAQRHGLNKTAALEMLIRDTFRRLLDASK